MASLDVSEENSFCGKRFCKNLWIYGDQKYGLAFVHGVRGGFQLPLVSVNEGSSVG